MVSLLTIFYYNKKMKKNLIFLPHIALYRVLPAKACL